MEEQENKDEGIKQKRRKRIKNDRWQQRIFRDTRKKNDK